jgi:hypothetical protein
MRGLDNDRGKGMEPKDMRFQYVWKQQQGTESQTKRRRDDDRSECGVPLWFNLRTLSHWMDHFGDAPWLKAIIPNGWITNTRMVALCGGTPNGIAPYQAGGADVLRLIHGIASRTSTNTKLFQSTILSTQPLRSQQSRCRIKSCVPSQF